MSPKQFEFTGKAGGYFLVSLVSSITAYIIIIGWPIGFNYTAGWMVGNLVVNGKKLKYTAGYGETLKFLFINILLTIITLGIYIFWFGPKIYRYVADHSSYDDAAAPVTPAPADTSTPVTPTTTPPTPPAPTNTPPTVVSA